MTKRIKQQKGLKEKKFLQLQELLILKQPN